MSDGDNAEASEQAHQAYPDTHEYGGATRTVGACDEEGYEGTDDDRGLMEERRDEVSPNLIEKMVVRTTAGVDTSSFVASDMPLVFDSRDAQSRNTM